MMLLKKDHKKVVEEKPSHEGYQKKKTLKPRIKKSIKYVITNDHSFQMGNGNRRQYTLNPE